MTLEFQGHEVIEAEEGKKGLEMARSEAPDLILLDLMMPGMSGVEVCRALKGDIRLSKIPVVLLSSSNDSNEIEECLQMGAVNYLLKPFKPPMLLDSVNEGLAKR
jgi:CheY-like chemotaxis protein